MLLAVCILFAIGLIVFLAALSATYDHEVLFGVLVGVMALLLIVSVVLGCLFGFIPHRSSEGVHTGIISAVDREGYFGNKYKIYLKTSQFTAQDDETVYYLYNHETELADKAKSLVGKNVVVKYSFEGGYISAWSAGENHIYSIEEVERTET